jgi:chitodextrinase
MSWRRSGVFVVVLLFISFFSSYPGGNFVGFAATTPQFIQENDNQVDSGRTSSVTFSAPTAAGNYLVVFLIWDNNSSASVSDSSGNVYTSAVSASRWNSNKYNAQVFYAKNLKSGTNTVTATFSSPINSFGIVYAHEYAGIDPTSPIDLTTSATGNNSGTLNSGSITTRYANDLLFAGAASWNTINAPSAGYVARGTAQGNLTEDRIAFTTANYSATATQSPGSWAIQLVAFRAASVTTDTTPPSVPTGLSAAAVSSSQINLSWTASTDPPNPAGQISYGCFRNGVRFATTAAGTTSCIDTGLPASTTYTYTVNAQDPSGNSSALSTGVQATTLAPPVPVITSFTAAPASIVNGQSSTLSWNVSNATSVSIDNGVGTVTGLTSASVHPTVTTVYLLTATNGAGPSTAQTTLTVTPDSTPPSVPTDLTANVISPTQINLTWTASTDQVDAQSQLVYSCYRNSVRFAMTPAGSTSCSDSGLTAGTTYTYTVAVQDSAGNLSAPSAGVQATTQTLPVPVITSFTAAPASIVNGQSSTLSWNVSNATSVTIDNGVGNVTGTTSVTVRPATTTVYLLTATNSFGSATAQTSVTVTTEATPPSMPTGLSVTVASYSQVNLSWAASSDPDDAPDQISYSCFRNGVRFATTALGVTSCSDTGLSASTTYTYAVSAQDAVGNSSAISAGVQATTLSLPVPTISYFGVAPNSIVAGQSGTLTWSVSNATSISVDNGVGTVTQTSSASVHPVTSTVYQLTATNSFGSVTAQAFLNVVADTAPPTVPTNISAVGISDSRIDISWNSSTDNVGTTGYQIYRNGALIATITGTSYSDTGLADGTSYTYGVAALDAAGNISAQATASTSTMKTDRRAPTIVISSPANNQTISGVVSITADAADDLGVVGVQFFVDGAKFLEEVTTAPFSVTWNTFQTYNTTHILTAVARDAAGNTTTSAPVTITINNVSLRPYSTNFLLKESPISEGGNWINGKADGIDWSDVQTVPGLAYGTQSGSNGYDDSVALVSGTWGPDQTVQATVHSVNQSLSYFEEVELWLRGSISGHSITGYEINFRCTGSFNAGYTQIVRWNGPLSSFTYVNFTGNGVNGVKDGDVVKANITGSTITVWVNDVQVAQGTDTVFTSGNPGMGFYLQGAAGVNSDFGFTNFLATDNTTIDTMAPTMPGNLSALGVSASQINLTWTPSSDNVAVAGYQVFRNSIQVGTSAGSSFYDVGLSAATQYTYSVAAFDAAGNVSLQSPASQATTLVSDTTPPSVPTGLQSSNITSDSATISWTSSTDNVGVAGYQVFRNGTSVGTTTTASFVDTGLAAQTTYNYTVVAYDFSNNASAQSQQIALTTAATFQNPPSFVQSNENQISSGTSVSVSFNAAASAGNTIVVYVIWDNTKSVTLTDSRGNTFNSVGAPVLWGSGNSAQIFYASGIAGGTDSVTATFRNSISNFGVVYIHEYSGISSVNPVGFTTSATGSSPFLNSGSISTPSTNYLIFGGGVSDNVVTAAGTNFISRDLAYGNITEDQIAATPGTYAATAIHNGLDWAMQVVAFRPAN